MKKSIQELVDSILYACDSKKGRYSLETYLTIVGEYADRLILSSEQEGYSYMGGHCKVEVAENASETIMFKVEMYFTDSNERYITKTAQRTLSSSKFTRDTIKRLNEFKKLEFDIEKPER